jgi:XTP/dITP diphosphohydrolase
LNIIFATQNKGKAKEVKDLFASTKYVVVSLADLGNDIEIEETGETLYENALLKAKAIFDIYKVPIISDDSGLMIEQLDGKPGVYSARYAGENCTYDDNNRKVIEELKLFPHPHPAKFVSHALYYDGEKDFSGVGELPGKIIDTPRGENGFGYDPIFIPDGYELTLGELTLEEKNKISHRAKAFNKLKEIIIEK